jgi:SAM-dependent methyltransferase
LASARSYTGIDWNERHIQTAQTLLGSDRVRFVCGDIDDHTLFDLMDRFDAVVGMGILHHLDDHVAVNVLNRVAGLLATGGRYIGVEPVLHVRQNPIARLLKALDSGQNIRTENGYRDLFEQNFADLNTRVTTDLMRVPYSHCIISASVK